MIPFWTDRTDRSAPFLEVIASESFSLTHSPKYLSNNDRQDFLKKYSYAGYLIGLIKKLSFSFDKFLFNPWRWILLNIIFTKRIFDSFIYFFIFDIFPMNFNLIVWNGLFRNLCQISFVIRNLWDTVLYNSCFWTCFSSSVL